MNRLKSSGKSGSLFSIKISGLSFGSYEYKYSADAHEFSDPEVTSKLFPSKINVGITIHKSYSELVAEIHVNAEAALECDLCLSPILSEIEETYKAYFLFESSEEHGQAGDDVRVIEKTASEIDLLEDVRDTLLLAIPLKNVCRDESECKANWEKNKSITYTGEPSNQNEAQSGESDWKKALREIETKLKTN